MEENKVVPKECYKKYGSDLHWCSRQEHGGCKGCPKLIDAPEEKKKLPNIPMLQIAVSEEGELVLQLSRDIVPYLTKTDAAKITTKFEQLSKILYKAGQKFALANVMQHQEDSEKFNEELRKLKSGLDQEDNDGNTDN